MAGILDHQAHVSRAGKVYGELYLCDARDVDRICWIAPDGAFRARGVVLCLACTALEYGPVVGGRVCVEKVGVCQVRDDIGTLALIPWPPLRVVTRSTQRFCRDQGVPEKSVEDIPDALDWPARVAGEDLARGSCMLTSCFDSVDILKSKV